MLWFAIQLIEVRNSPTVAIVTIAKYKDVMYRFQRSISLK